MLASPGSHSEYYIASVDYVSSGNHRLYNEYYSFSGLSFRPLVCLKPEASLKKQDNGTYDIVMPEVEETE